MPARDLSASRVSRYRSDQTGMEHRSEGPADAVNLQSFGWLDDQLAACIATVTGVLSEMAPVVLHSEIVVAARATALVRLDGSSAVRRDVAAVIRLVVQGTHSRVPVLWQVGTPVWPPAALTTHLPQELPLEVRAAATGVPLEEPLPCPVVLAPWPASQLIHECMGHTAEGDNSMAYVRPAGYDLGYRWTEVPLTVVDDPLASGYRGSYTVDDEGEPAVRTQLITQGVWTHLLHSRATAAEPAARGGNGRRVAGAPHALPRMSVTYAAAGNSTVTNLFTQVAEGLYCVGAWGGGSIGRQFMMRPTYARRIRDGQLTEHFVRRFDLRGDKFATIRQIAGVGDDLQMFDPAFGCDKFGQHDLPVTFGAPHLYLRELELHPIRR